MKTGLNEYCERTEDCKIANTVCNTDRNTCECKPNFDAQNDEECKPVYGADCEVTEDCAFDNADCKVEVVDETSTKKCRCNDDYVGIGSSCFERGENFLKQKEAFIINFFFQQKATTTLAKRVNNANRC